MVYLSTPLELELSLSDEQFFELCQKHSHLRFERNADGDIIIMPPTGGWTSDRNSDLNYQLRAWNKRTKLGKVFESSGGFRLPNGADRSPDASWLKLERWEALTTQEKERFLPLCPDFVIELRSPSDSVSTLQDKMQEYMENGAKLGWLIDPQRQVVEIYRPGLAVETLEKPKTVSGEDVLIGFELDLTEIFN